MEPEMPPRPAPSETVRFAALPAGAPHPFDLAPAAEARAALARDLDLLGLRKLRFSGTLRPEGAGDWVLDGRLGATVVQPCRVTLEPVTTRLDEPVFRRYLAEMPAPPPGGETEMPEDESAEPLPATLDLAAVMAEALALALPAFPRAPGAEPGDTAVTEPGKAPLTDAELRPFAALAALRDKLGEGDAEPRREIACTARESQYVPGFVRRGPGPAPTHRRPGAREHDPTPRGQSPGKPRLRHGCPSEQSHPCTAEQPAEPRRADRGEPGRVPELRRAQASAPRVRRLRPLRRP
jgi:uncharacterized metal-binding protein YceD (DUF177 family)